MKRTRRLTITMTRPASTGAAPSRLYCTTCRAEVLALTFVQLAALLGTDETGIARLAAGGNVHLVKTEAGDVRVCGPSLPIRGLRGTER